MFSVIRKATLFSSLVFVLSTTALAQNAEINLALSEIADEIEEFMKERQVKSVFLGEFRATDPKMAATAKSGLDQRLKELNIDIVDADKAKLRLRGRCQSRRQFSKTLMSMEVSVQDNFLIELAAFRKRVVISEDELTVRGGR